MTDLFRIPITVRGYETDSQGHLNMSVYVQYAEHARWSALRAAGITQAALLDKGVGPVTLETTIKYLRELRAGDETEVSCAFVWGDGKTFRIEQTIHRADGELSAEIASVAGLLDLTTRRLVPSPREAFAALAAEPGVLGL